MAKQNWKAARSRTRARRQRKARWSGESRDRWQLIARVAFPGSLLVGLLILLGAIVQWINPVPSPKLILLTTRNAVEILPPNASAAADARMLQSLESVFDVSDADASPANFEQMLAIIDGTEQHTPRQQLLAPWKSTTTVFYVNAIGVGLLPPGETDESSREAWLVPGDFDPLEEPRSQLVSFTDLVESITASAADRKLLVLDCQRPSVHAYFGSGGNRFVDAVLNELQKLNDTPGKTSGLYVLVSSSSGEASWPMHPASGSVFGRYFTRGVTGEADLAGDRNDRVTLDELVEYLNTEVSRWAADYCVASQHPQLVDFGQDSASVVIAAGRAKPHGPTALPADGGFSRSEVAAGLERNWTRYFDLYERPQPPVDWAPVQWNYIQDRLLLAERLHRSGDYGQAGVVLHDLDAAFDLLIETHRSLRQLMAASAPSAVQFLSRCCASDWKELAGIGVASADRELITDYVEQTAPLDQTAQGLEESALATDEPLSAPAQFLRLVSTRPATDDAYTLHEDEEALRELLGLKLLAEDVARPEHPLVSRWIQRAIDRADEARRASEDRALLGSWRPLPVGAVISENVDPAAQFSILREQKEQLSDAYRLRDRLLAELPFWIAFLDSSEPHIIGWDSESEVVDGDVGDERTEGPETVVESSLDGEAPGEPCFAGAEYPQEAARLVQTLLGDLQVLTADLLADPQGFANDDEIQRHVARIDTRRRKAALELNRLTDQLLGYTNSLSQERLATSTGDTWRRIDSLLRLPLPMDPGNGEVPATPRDHARLRMLLVSRTDEQLQPPQDCAPSQLTAESDRHGEFIERSYQHLYCLAIRPGSAEFTDQTLAEFTPDFIRRSLIDLTDVSGGAPPERDAQFRAELAFRLLRRGLGTDLGVTSPVIELRTRSLAESLLWQSERVARDFYASVIENREPYYDRLASQLLRAAENLAGAGQILRRGAEIESVEMAADTADAPVSDLDFALNVSRIEDELRQFAVLLQRSQSSGLKVEPAGIEFRATFSEVLKVNVLDAGELPTGIAAVSVESTEAVEPLSDVAESVGFLVQRPADAFDSNSRMNLMGYYRGHRLNSIEQQVGLAVITGLDGQSAVYADQNSGNARLRLRARPLDQDPLQLLFVLDCSGSMALPDESGESRVASLRAVLTEFASHLEPGTVQVGIRLFGHRDRDIRSPEARTDTELILPIGTFGAARLQDVLSQLRPVGHSPIFNALIQAREDFPNDETGRREIVLISDGADNWALAGQTPGIEELKQTFLGAGIRINAVGYQVDGFADFLQLQQIASAGDLSGRCVTVDSARSLLREVAGLAGLQGFRILNGGRLVHEEYQFSQGGPAIELPPGDYDLEVVGPGRNVVARKSVRLLPGEEHDLVYDSATLAYGNSPRASAVAIARGTDDHPDLVVLEAQRIDDELILEFGLLNKQDNQSDLSALSASIIAVTQDGHGAEWHLNNLRPNVGNRHFPTWRVTLENWPTVSDASGALRNVHGALLKVTWNDPSVISERVEARLDWESRFIPDTVADNVLFTRREAFPITIDGIRHDATMLTFVLKEKRPGIERWGISTPQPVLYSRHIYDREHGIYNVQFVPWDDSRPDQVALIQSMPPQSDRSLEVLIPFGDERINR